MKGITIRDFMGDYALDIPMGEGCVHTIYFNSHRNAETVKRIMEVDDGIPNAATVCDMVEVVRCKGCKHSTWSQEPCHGKVEYRCKFHGFEVDKHFYCGSGERKEQT